MKTLITHSIIALGMLSSLQSAHAAGESGFYSGGNCKAMYGSDTSSFRTDTVGLWYTSNLSGNKAVICPVTRQNPLNNNGTQNITIRVRSFGGKTLTCTSQALDINASLIASKSASTTSNSLTTLNLTLGSSAAFGTYAIFCSVPPNGSVWYYSVIEK